MNKRITSILLCFVMIISMLATAVPALAAGTLEFKLTPDKTEANPGDVITFTVSMTPVEKFAGMLIRAKLIPDGMTYISGKAESGIQEKLGADSAEYTDSTKTFLVGISDLEGYTSTTDTVLFSFQCKVNDDASGDLHVGLEIPTNEVYDADLEDIPFINNGATIKVTAKPVAVTGVSLNKDELSLKAGESETLTATVDPTNATNKTVTWKSSDTSVATVDNNGKVTGVKKGTATITVTTADGNYTASCAVTVNCAHANTTSVPAKASTCQVHGNSAYTVCNDCNMVIAGDATPLPLAGHTFKNVAEVSATHYADGVAAHKECTVCNKIFTTAEVETTLAALTIKKGDHTPAASWTFDADKHWHECTVDSEKLDVASHNWQVVIDKNATEDETGLSHEKCSVCDATQKVGTVIPKLDHTHNLVKVPAVAATCETDGNNEYYHCTKCGNDYKDATGSVLTSAAAEKIDATGHTPGTAVKENEVAATCTAEGSYDEVIYCTTCNNELNRTTKTTEKLAHNWQVVIDKAATEDAEGESHEECSLCHSKRNEGTVIPKLDHTHNMVKVDAVAATCTAEGNNEYYHCTKCDQYFKDATGNIPTTVAAEVTEKIAHTSAEAVKENVVAATCTAEGSYDEVVYCSVCNTELNRTTKTETQLSHNYAWKVTTPATTEAEGVESEYCTVGGELTGNTRAIAKLPVEYEITKGAKQTVEQGKEAAFTSNADFAKFVKATVDGADVDSDNYTVAEGSTIVTLKSDYTKTLAVGTHTLDVVSNDGTASTTFEVKAVSTKDDTTTKTDDTKSDDSKKTTDTTDKTVKSDDKATSPKTGDVNNLALWIAILFVSGGAVSVLGVKSSRRKKIEE